MTTDAWFGVLAYAAIFVPFIVATVGCFLWAVLHTKRNQPADFYEPYGDASDTPTMLHNTRRVNFKREDA
jgi:hypothetical protein